MSDYPQKIDRFEIAERNEQRAGELLSEIESGAKGNAVTFLTSNLKNKKIRDRLTEPNFELALAAMITKISGLAGCKGEISDFDKDDIAKLIMRKYGEISAEEIVMAFMLERHGDLLPRTEHFGLFNAEYFSKVVDKYKSWKLDMKRAHNMETNGSVELPKELKEFQSMDDIAKEKMVNDGIVRRFETFKENGKIETPCAHIFDTLYERKLFPTDTPYQICLKLAKDDITAELKSKVTPDKGDRNKIKEAISALENPNNEMLMARAKYNTLTWYFQKLIDDRIDINQILK